jgi:sulfur-oxidizing protein SoxA
VLLLITLAGLTGLTFARAHSQETGNLPAPVSGYASQMPETRDIQDDDDQNPGFLWIDYGAELWDKADGTSGKSCASCHDRPEETMRGIGATYPKFDELTGRLINLEQRINRCRQKNQLATEWAWETQELLSITTLIRHQSRGMPISVNIDGAARPFFEKGQDYFYRRMGQMDMACANCHEKYVGKHLRSDLLTQAQINGWPVYSMGYTRVVSTHEIFRHCNQRIRAIELDFGADEYVNLELYMNWRGNGLLIETPAVR